MSDSTDASTADRIIVESDVMVPMRDGVRLATDIYRLPGAAPLPVILERTPYGKALPSRSEFTARDNDVSWTRLRLAEFFARAGYVVVFQDCRGRYGSEGEFTKYLSEGPDGYDTIEWLAAQLWCDGRVATVGLSYAAHAQAAAACLAPDALVCMFLDSGGFSNAFRSGIRQGGAFELKQATWAYRNALQSAISHGDDDTRARLEKEDIHQWFARMPWHRGDSPVKWSAEYEDYLFDQWEHGTFDDFWKALGIYGEGFYEWFSDVPMMHMASWYDPYARAATENYLGLKSRKKGPVHLILGPWTHGRRMWTYAGDVDFGPAACFDGNIDTDYPTYRLRWYDHWLKGARNGIESEPAVRLFVMGGGSGRKSPQGRLMHGGTWRNTTDWPVPGTAFTPYFLHGGGGLSPDAPTGDAEACVFMADPSSPVPTIGGAFASGAPIMEAGAYDQREGPDVFGAVEPYRRLADRDDVLVFQTPPLTEAVEVTGPVIARLCLSSDCPDTDVTAKLVDVYPPNEDYPDGFEMNLTSGILRVRYRESFEQPRMMEPETVYEIEVELFPTANRFMPGHRIRLDIAGSNFPHFDVNPNSGEPEGRADHPRVATNRIHVGSGGRSQVILPIIPR